MTGIRSLRNPVWNVTVVPRFINVTQNVTVGNRTTLVNISMPVNFTSDMRNLTNALNAIQRTNTNLTLGTQIM